MIVLHCTRPGCGHDEAQHLHHDPDRYRCAAAGCDCASWRHPADALMIGIAGVVVAVWCAAAVVFVWRFLAAIAGWLS